MLAIPAIDIKDGKVVRLHKGDYNNMKVYNENPVELVEIFHNAGFKRIHIVDLDGSRTGKSSIINLLKGIISNYEIVIEFGGGIREVEDIALLTDTGVHKIIIGSMLFTNRNGFISALDKYGPDKFIVAADVLDKVLQIKGWTQSTQTDIYHLSEFGLQHGINEYLITDISKDGTLQGPSFNLYEEIQERYPEINIITSGGVSGMKDIKRLADNNAYAVVVGKALYENKIKIEELVKYAG